ncbi:protein of unknown function [Pedobacter sp. ok626]|uniref:DUF4269 domain-containing protein n=1 Tax=Pedobacter sp. ok626 TaxID=1761882 RepID=UPI00088ECE6D|nr:DUF4269 domain-containing protein [Pedobacter sp. ok626]SDL10279.1 protein of unknown function [Pedobacter sp. ok626]
MLKDETCKFLNIDYLKTGNKKQIKAYITLTENKILEKLSAYDPILVGTIPIHIDIASSDLDIICYVKDMVEFSQTLGLHFRNKAGFTISENSVLKSTKANFFIDGFEFEIFGQNIPTIEQYAYRHMLIEDRLLREKGELFRIEIIKLKKQGIKTEPAFAHLLGLKGNPFEALLQFESDKCHD